MTSFFMNLRIGMRLALCFSVIVALILALAAFTLFQLEAVRGVTAEASGIQAERLSPGPRMAPEHRDECAARTRHWLEQ
jgi:hypothetical protein